MARISIRDLPDELHARLAQLASEHQRSIEGEIRFALGRYANEHTAPKPPTETSSTKWKREAGQRIRILIERLREDGYFSWKKSSDLPSIALSIGLPSPVPLMDIIDGHAELTFDLAKSITDHYGCNLQWLMNGTGSIFPYPAVHHTDLLEPALDSQSTEVKLVRICRPKRDDGARLRYDGTLLMFCIDKATDKITAGYAHRFYLNGDMGGGGHADYASFVKYISEYKYSLPYGYNFYDDLDEEGIWNHHPCYYLSKAIRADWMIPMLEGHSPGAIDWQPE